MDGRRTERRRKNGIEGRTKVYIRTEPSSDRKRQNLGVSVRGVERRGVGDEWLGLMMLRGETAVWRDEVWRDEVWRDEV